MEHVLHVQSLLPQVPSFQYNVAATCIAIVTIGIAFPRQKTRLRGFLSFLVLAHSLWILRSLLVEPPFNFYVDLNLPFMIPVKILRVRAKEHLQENYTTQLDELINRFSSFDMRSYYVRFGHDVLLYCDYCHSQLDFSLFSVALSLPFFVISAGLLAAISSEQNHRKRFRAILIILMIVLFGGEVWYQNFTRFDVPLEALTPRPPKIIMLHDSFIFLRQLALLILPIIAHFILPPTPPTLNPLAFLRPSEDTLRHTNDMTQTISVLRNAGLRNTELRERYYARAEARHEDVSGVLGDKELQEEARKHNLSYDEGPPPGPLLQKARNMSAFVALNMQNTVMKLAQTSPSTS